MDLYTVNKTTYKAEKVVEGWDSLIWTERYSDCGDFELRTPLVEQVMDILPEDSLCCIAQSGELMWVETHDIQVDDDGNDILVVKGSSFESFFKKRAIFGTYKAEWKTPVNYNAQDAPAMMVWNYLVQNSGWDRLRPTSYGINPRDLLPNVAVGKSAVGTVHAALPAMEWWLAAGPFYEQMRDWLLRGGMGIRCIRPGGPSMGPNARTFTPDTAGNPNSANRDVTDSRLIIEVYNGMNRTKIPVGSKSVIFSHAQGHITSSNYVSSIKDYYTVAHVTSNVGSVDVYAPEFADGLVNGYDRKMLWLDGGDVGDQDQVAFITALVQKGEIELAKHRRGFVFDGEFSEDAYAYGDYNNGYMLGDKVSVIGQYGFAADMVVTEYVRTEDGEGERGFPTLSLI